VVSCVALLKLLGVETRHLDYTPSGIVHQLSEYVQERPDLHGRRIEVIKYGNRTSIQRVIC